MKKKKWKNTKLNITFAKATHKEKKVSEISEVKTEMK